MDPNILKHAYNAAFEWYCLNTAGYETPLEQWNCTMIHGLYCGYTAGLDATGKAIGLPQDKQKLTTGKGVDPIFLSCLVNRRKVTGQNVESAEACTGKMGAFQRVL